MGSGARQYRIALGEYQALQEHLRAQSEIQLEHERQLLELEQQRYELQKAGKIPGLEPATDVNQPMYFTTPAVTTETAPAIDVKKLILPGAIVAFLILRKK
ncbi:MAG: hypothetical protein AMJ79_11840 [Phycisphaerae bacterium SM23_30]|nr:MAG: hypothetical protein AMJ79_11840 [Phycisphaerae bacterium SM23_30]